MICSSISGCCVCSAKQQQAVQATHSIAPVILDAALAQSVDCSKYSILQQVPLRQDQGPAGGS